ncbi:BamA/TamA family outer membrane protein [Flammeovirga yaeyamensis]|uniref:BamA/TamA family outer membrane protein n=1 Tax=Flammeovirga yaeyamensis TaxID=367791 RepID=A0AAX1MZM0_9BACT|nr:BamA/TamA family outer membrane protein [Flammeovirga yaeyamensis]MBB3700917.1 outer membrane protein assembly factor BamA [Flammeovirga yaeyamensis]NMF38025.1 BamA/TamA family outer membrane protein [Flammeovirga yaeyamensis]QWG00675.1 BamA/TamA family outer membrane protein [Flammeovirga yaeyamensis]
MQKYLFTFLLFICSFHSTFGQSFDTGGGGERSDKKFQFMPIPYINYDRTLGLSVGALPMAMYNLSEKDTISPSSVSGLLGMYTTNESWFVLGFSKFYFNEDKYRVTVAAGTGNFNFQTFVGLPINGFVKYNTGVNFAKGEIQRKIVNHLYLGVNYMYTDFKNQFDIGTDTTFVTELQTLGFIVSYDQRDNVYYPTKGQIADINIDFNPNFLGNEQTNTKVTLAFNKFFAFKEGRDVLAARAYIGFGIGDLTFNQQFIVGDTDIRGYTQAKYRGNAMYNLQAEYRWNFHKKMALNFFGGLATVSGANESSQNGILLPGAGIGYRYTVFPKNHMNVGLDAAVGRDDWGIYFRIGEAF